MSDYKSITKMIHNNNSSASIGQQLPSSSPRRLQLRLFFPTFFDVQLVYRGVLLTA